MRTFSLMMPVAIGRDWLVLLISALAMCGSVTAAVLYGFFSHRLVSVQRELQTWLKTQRESALSFESPQCWYSAGDDILSFRARAVNLREGPAFVKRVQFQIPGPEDTWFPPGCSESLMFVTRAFQFAKTGLLVRGEDVQELDASVKIGHAFLPDAQGQITQVKVGQALSEARKNVTVIVFYETLSGEKLEQLRHLPVKLTDKDQ